MSSVKGFPTAMQIETVSGHNSAIFAYFIDSTVNEAISLSFSLNYCVRKRTDSLVKMESFSVSVA